MDLLLGSALAGPGSARSEASPAVRAHSAAPLVPVGVNPVGVAVDQATNTVYVANASNTVSVIDGATCNARVTSGCGKTPETIKSPGNPLGAAVDEKTDTVYVPNIANNTVSVINGAICNAEVTSGCGQTPTIVKVGSGPNVDTVDQATDTVYVANGNTDTVSVIDGATCNAKVTSGCKKTPPTVKVGSGPDAWRRSEPTRSTPPTSTTTPSR